MTKDDFRTRLDQFQRSESGAVQVDWVHLTVIAVGMGMLLNSSLLPAAGRASEALSTDIAKALKRPDQTEGPSSRRPRTTGW